MLTQSQDTKSCSGCATEKAVELFSKYTQAKDGLQPQCKACKAQYKQDNADVLGAKQVLYRANNPGKATEYARISRELKPEMQNEANARYRAAHPERRRACFTAWAKANPGKVNALRSKRRAAQLERTPPWSDLQEISLIYQQSASLKKLLGRDTHVDHVVPLQGDLVSGLHVPHNLQIMFASDNCAKSNKFDIQEFNR